MPVKNNLIIGFLLGAILPLLAYFITEVIFKGENIAGKPGTPYLIAVGINLILLKIFNKNDAGKAETGVMLVSFLVALLTFVFKIKFH